MQLVFHTGAHFAEDERLLKCLLQNAELLSGRGVQVPEPSRYRSLVRDTIVAMEQAPAAADARDVLLDAMLDGGQADRAVLSVKHLFGVPRALLDQGMLYPKAPIRLSHLGSVFAQDDVEVFMAIRNPVTFLPACCRKTSLANITEFLKGTDPREIRWSRTFFEMRAAVPDVPITVWCNEDAPLVWAQVVREMGGLEHSDDVKGGFDLLSDIITTEGMAQFVAYVNSKPGMSEMQLRRVTAALMEKFAISEAVEEELDVPEWSSDLVDEMTEIYDEDVRALSRIPGVTVISP